ncbi:beta-ketoacyl-ACP reductase [Pseudobacteriovorax antillogorgiicola]|uniref:3-oxoacyl-[acyl-carrier-protein] reductase n=1 Tax=Pseudobacteriovorax antillogorgiicola TaxID=1513793 RepID=A0A1Y6BWY5_9BACT|nr:beta-ketoacyl-ACP reductase [Pseudobacteriovorax antillogorgiicola]TCS50272.1 3-oxoacyl-[acyl-carrier-protein] reductase [Pseudobacteriovorax antillogorgiicola]SMF33500.1 3-oxoacyl-[acyl-carrier-protein] reductase [Pseudobacteriovorax antillogorgiicola]
MTDLVALVTGASRGIGRACAEELGRQGYKVAIHYRGNEDLARQVAESIPGSKIFQADVAEEEQCKALIKSVKEEFGRIDVLVNNAGMSIDQVLTFAKPADFERLLDVNVKSVFNLSKLVSKVMIKQKKGSIINLTSVVGHTGNGGQSMYAATKGAITSFTKSIASDLAGFGIRANCVAPGFIETDMTNALPEEVKEAILKKVPLKRLGTGNEVAKTVHFLASDASSYVTGSTIHVNGGMFTN